MKKRILSLLLTLLMLVGMIPATSLSAFAAAGGEVYVGGVKMSDGTYLAVGATATQTTKPSGGYAYYKDGTLTLNNYSYKGKGYLNISSSYYEVIYSKNDLTLELIGNNTLTHTYSDTDLIYVDGANLTVGGDGKLTGTADNYGLYADKDITINGGTIELSTFHAGIFSCDDVIINDGDITAESEIDDGIYASCDVTINGGHVTAIGNAQAIRYDSSYSFTVAKGMEIQASTTVDGTLGEYVAAYHSTYKKIEVRPAHAIYVGDVCMDDGDYLAVGATATQTTKPSGGYAYYKDGKLTLNNYSYEGTGYQYISIGYCAIVYAKHDLTLELVGTNSLVQERENSDVICIQSEDDGGCLTIDGTGSLSATTTVGYAGIEVDGTLTVNGGTIDCAAKGSAMISRDQDIIINGGNVTASGRIGLNAPDGNVKINGGNVLATGTTSTWGAISATNFTVAEGMKIQASTTADGALGEYVASKHSNYKKIVIESPAINTVNVSATWSGTPKDATTSTTGAAVTATKWYRKSGSNWVQLGSFDTIYSEYTYRCEVTVGATSGYTLADGYTVKINGIAATKKSGNTWYRDVTITGYTTYVDVYDIALPEAGAKPDFTYNDVECRYSSVALVEWFECDKDGKKLSGALSADYKFKEDAYYRLEVTVVPDANYKFFTRDLDFYIGAKAAQYYYPYQDTTYPDSVTGWKVYHVDDANGTYTIQIGDITLKDGDYLANNATAVTTSKPVGGYAYYKDGVLTLNNFVSKNLIRYYERYLEVELIGENKIGAIADYYYWDGNASNNYYTGLEFRGDGNLDFGYYSDKPYSNVSVNGDVFFNGSGNISLDAEIYCFQFTDNVIINDGYVSCYCAQSNVFSGNANITVNGGKLQMTDGGCWYGSFICEDDLLIYAGNVYVSVDPRKIELEDCVPWDGVTDLNTYDNVWIVDEKVSDTDVTVNCIGDIDYTVSGQTVTVDHEMACNVSYLDGTAYKSITAVANGDGTYSFTAPAGVTEVFLVIKGDLDLDGSVSISDVTTLLNVIAGKSTLEEGVDGDLDDDGSVSISDVTKLLNVIAGKEILI